MANMMEALRLHGLDLQGVYRVPGRLSKIREITSLANSNADLAFDLLTSDRGTFDGRAISSAIKQYLTMLPTSLLDAEVFAAAMTEDVGRSLRAPASLARTLRRLLTALMSSIDCPGGKTVSDREREWRLATLDFAMCHFREVVGLQALNCMSPCALAVCLSPSLFGTVDNVEANSQKILCLSTRCWSS
ncbi:unnamed protein product [Dibothriocephalus latus]|uniref:Rho-GAP domain-containing protein n=1 Tax=Dibothriocephalus latus TaxID=60516 RepID=A0A3P6QDC4_DIBLA|nr:unnamed protein product [Dibothriocephalus latus]